MEALAMKAAILPSDQNVICARVGGGNGLNCMLLKEMEFIERCTGASVS